MLRNEAAVEFWDGKRIKVPLADLIAIDERQHEAATESIAAKAAQRRGE